MKYISIKKAVKKTTAILAMSFALVMTANTEVSAAEMNVGSNINGYNPFDNSIYGDTVLDEHITTTMEKKYTSTTHVSNFGYWIYKPVGYENEKLPLIVYMHGIGERGNNLDKLIRVSLPKYLYEQKIAEKAIVICPQCPTSTNWTNLADDVMELINIVKTENNIDESSIGLTGHSLGGIGTWRIALKYPDVFASLVPVSGTINDPKACVALKDVAIWAFHGSRDSMTPTSMLQAEKNIKAAGGEKMEVTLFPTLGHTITNVVYDNPEYNVVRWMASQHRADKINIQTETEE